MKALVKNELRLTRKTTADLDGDRLDFVRLRLL